MLRKLLLTPLHRALCTLPKPLPLLFIALFVLLPSLFRSSSSRSFASPKPLPPLFIALFVLLLSLFRSSPSLLIYKRTAGQRLLCPSRQDGVIMVRAVWGGCLMPPRNLV